jgi:hypothetical protein
VLQPRAVGYKFFFERIQVDANGSDGTRIRPERDLDLDREIFLSPEVNVQFQYKILGFMARLHVTFINETLHGLVLLDRDIRFRRSVFPAGAIVGSEFTHRRARVQLFQEVYTSERAAFDVRLGAEYFFFRNVLTSPGLTRAKDITESALPMLGARAFYKPVPWLEIYSTAYAFYWNFGGKRLAGSVEGSVGAFVRIFRNWGFMLDFTAVWIAMREDAVRLHYVEFGPGVILYACL